MFNKDLFKHLFGKFNCMKNGIKYENGVYIGHHVHFTNAKNITIGRNVQIRPYCDMFAGDVFIIRDGCDIGTRNRISGNVIIESDVLIGPDNYICMNDHIYDDPNIPIMQQGSKIIKKNGHSELKIGCGTWIGTHCSIIGDVHIGKNCVIGANSVITRDIPDYSVAVGIPAKVIKQYNFSTKSWEKV